MLGTWSSTKCKRGALVLHNNDYIVGMNDSAAHALNTTRTKRLEVLRTRISQATFSTLTTLQNRTRPLSTPRMEIDRMTSR